MIDASIPLQIKRPQFATPTDAMSLRDLANRVKASEYDQSPEQRQLKNQLTMAQIGHLTQGRQESSLQRDKFTHEQSVQLAKGFVSLPPEMYEVAYPELRRQAMQLSPEASQLPERWTPELLPRLQMLAGGMTKEQMAEAKETRDYPATPQAQPPVPMNQIGEQVIPGQGGPDLPGATQAPAIVKPANLTQPQAVPIAPNEIDPVEVTAQAPEETPDGLKKLAKETEARGGKVNYEKAKDLRARAEKLEDTIFKEREQITPFGELGITFNKTSGKFFKDGKEINSDEIQKIALAQAKAKATTVTVGQNASDAAKTELLNQGISDMAEFKSLVMPDGKIDRELIAGLAVPGVGGVPGTDSRIAYSLIYNAIEAKLRAESGAAVPEQEVERMAKRFIPSPLDNDETIKSKVRRMEAFLRGSFSRIKGAGEPTVKPDATGMEYDDPDKEKRYQEFLRKQK